MGGKRKYTLGLSAAMAAGVSLAALIATTPIAYANPEGGTVVSGGATISQNGNKLDIHQTSTRALIDWRSFNIAEGEHTQFYQPSSSAVAVNRINDINPSVIAGKLSANGNIVLINPNGMMFTNTAVVDVNGILATTANIDTATFNAGALSFDKFGNADAKIINNGLITAADAGLVGLVAPQVENNGVIIANFGHVKLASVDTAVLDFYGDDLLKVAVVDPALEKQLVKNTGKITAEGGTVALTAATARNVLDSLIHVEGELAAPVVEEHAGKIIIRNDNANGNVTVKATLDASGRDAGEQGGQIEVLAGGDIALLDGTFIDASGHSAVAVDPQTSATLTAENTVRTEDDFWSQQTRAGGSIKIGGDYLGQGDTLTAQNLYVAPMTLVLNDAVENGDGGRTIFWADNATEFGGFVFSRGGLNGGHGGFVETSGKNVLNAHGYVDLRNRAEGYHQGGYLLDPANIAIYGNVDGQFVSTDGAVDLSQGQVLNLTTTDAPNPSDYYTGTAAPAATFAGFGTVADTDVNRTANAVFTVDLTIPASPEGVIYEQGGSGFGTYVGFQADGTLVFHAGRGTGFTANDAAHLEIAPGSAPTGSGTLSWDINVSTNTITAYWNGVQIGSDTAASSFTSWSGGDDGGFGQATNSIVVGANTNNFNGTFGTGLKYYNNFGGFLTDQSGSGNNASITAGAPTVTSNVINGQAAVVMNNADQFEIADTNDINLLAQNGISRSFTFETDADVTTEQILFKEGGGTNGYVVYLENGFLNVGLYNNGGSQRAWRQYAVTGDTAYQLSSVFDATSNTFTTYLNGVEQTGTGLGANVAFAAHSGDNTFGRSDGAIVDQNGAGFTPTNTISKLGETIFHNVAIDADVQQVLDQYEAGRFGISLAGPGTGADEVTRATAADGYSAFTTRYLEHLSSMADVNLVADNNITLDLQGDTLTLANNRALSLTATNGQISDLSAGAIVSYNADISLSAGTNIGLTQTSLQAGGNGAINMNAGGSISHTQAKTLRLGTVNGASIFLRTTDADADIALTDQITATGAGNALTLVTGQNFVNHTGTNALSAANGRWLVYSNDPVADTDGGLKPSFRTFDAPYAQNLPASIAKPGKGFIYVTDVIPAYLQNKKLPTTVSLVSQLPALQLAPPTTPRGNVEGDIFEMTKPLRLQLEDYRQQDRSSQYNGRLRVAPSLKRQFQL